MADLFDYLDWRGDLGFSQAGFNEADSLILCALAFVPLDGVVPGPGKGEAIPLAQAAERPRFAALPKPRQEAQKGADGF